MQYIRNPRLIKLQTGSHGAFPAAAVPRGPGKLWLLGCQWLPAVPQSSSGPAPAAEATALLRLCRPLRVPLASPRSPDAAGLLSGLHRALKIPHATVAHTAVLGTQGKKGSVRLPRGVLEAPSLGCLDP